MSRCTFSSSPSHGGQGEWASRTLHNELAGGALRFAVGIEGLFGAPRDEQLQPRLQERGLILLTARQQIKNKD